MDTQRQPFLFGPYEVRPQTGELRKHGVRVRLASQPFQILLFLLENAGEVVSREQLREHVWSDGTVVDFEHGLNAALNKIRRTLGDSADEPRYIQTVPGRGYRFIGTLEGATQPEIRESLPGRKNFDGWRRAALLAGGVLVAGAIGWWWRQHRTEPAPSWHLAPLTTSAALEDGPSLSPDGKLVVYSSDPSFTGKVDLYVKHLSGGTPIRLTTDGAGNRMPDFSPDGSRIVFRSNRDGGGIYQMPVLGGEIQLVVRGGLNPKFSPDGTQVAYWTGSETVGQTIPGSGAVWVAPAGGGRPRQIARGLPSARDPIWSPDGKYLLLAGYASAKALDLSNLDWWIVSVDGDRLIRTGLSDELIRRGIRPLDVTRNSRNRTPVPRVPLPGCWQRDKSTVISAIESSDNRNLWEVGIAPDTGRVTGLLRRLTTGAGSEQSPACSSAETLAFTSVQIKRQLWRLPYDLNRAKQEGELRPVVEDAADRENPSFSADGRYLAFVSDQSGRPNIWLKEMASGRETQLASSALVQRYPLISPSSRRIAYSVYESDKRRLYVAEPSGAPDKLCEDCLRATDWTPDESALLVHGGDPYRVSLLTLGSHTRTPVLKHEQYSLFYARFSPDQHWISFTIRMRSDRAAIAIAPTSRAKPIPESTWISIADVGLDDYAIWSPDSKILYFTSFKDGNSCLWGQRIDPRSGRPVGETFAVQHFHGRISYGHGGWSASNTAIVFGLVETTSNVWTMSR